MRNDDDVNVITISPAQCAPECIPYAVAATYANAKDAGQALHWLTRDTVNELGVAGYEVNTCSGVFGPPERRRM